MTMVDEVVEAELALRQRHVARVVPIGDVDVVVGEACVRTVPRSSVAKWPDSGATSSTRGCGRSISFAKCSRVQNGVRRTASSRTATLRPPTGDAVDAEGRAADG